MSIEGDPKRVLDILSAAGEPVSLHVLATKLFQQGTPQTVKQAFRAARTLQGKLMNFLVLQTLCSACACSLSTPRPAKDPGAVKEPMRLPFFSRGNHCRATS